MIVTTRKPSQAKHPGRGAARHRRGRFASFKVSGGLK
jgi:hypothetical protein